MTPSDIVTGTSLSTTTPFVSGRSYGVHRGPACAVAGTSPDTSRVRRASVFTVITGNDRAAWKIARWMYEEAIAEMQIRAPAERNPKLAALLEAVNADMQLKAWWYAQQNTANRLQMSDHSWIHVQKVMNIALRLLRL